jgi:hypothetical protein
VLARFPAFLVFLIFPFLSSVVVAASAPAVIVIGFVGGFVRHNDTIHPEASSMACSTEDVKFSPPIRYIPIYWEISNLITKPDRPIVTDTPGMPGCS